MARTIIAIDIDDVLANNAAGFVEFTNKRWGTNLAVDDYNEHWAKVWKTEHDLDETIRRRDEFISSRVHRNFQSADGAHDVLRKLSERFELAIITSRMRSMKIDTKDWLLKHYSDIFTEKSIHYAGIWDTMTHESVHATKAAVMEFIGAEYLIDDQLKHCEAIVRMNKTALLFGNYGWNQSSALNSAIVRVNDWQAVGAYFDGIKQ